MNVFNANRRYTVPAECHIAAPVASRLFRHRRLGQAAAAKAGTTYKKREGITLHGSKMPRDEFYSKLSEGDDVVTYNSIIEQR